MRALRLVLLITALFMLAEVAGGVSNVHDLHVWTVTSGVAAMSGMWSSVILLSTSEFSRRHGADWRR